MSQLVNDVAYQHQLRARLPAPEGASDHRSADLELSPRPRPPQPIAVTASVHVDARLDEERRVFAMLDVSDLEQLAAESQALVDRALALGRARLAATSIAANAFRGV